MIGLPQRRSENPVGEWLDDAGVLSERNELIRRHHPASRVVPAQQRLEADRRSSLDVDQRLVVQGEAVVLDGGAELRHQSQVAGSLVLEIRVENRHAPAAALRHMQRDVGAPEEDVRATTVLRVSHHPDAGSDSQWVAVDEEGLFQGRVQLFGYEAGLLLIGSQQQNAELVAADTGDQVILAHALPDPASQLLEDVVPRQVAKRFVDLLEMIQVEGEHGQRPSLDDRCVHPLLELDAVGQLC